MVGDHLLPDVLDLEFMLQRDLLLAGHLLVFDEQLHHPQNLLVFYLH